MANEVMGGLFGMSPEALTAARDRQAQEQALAVARLNPFEQARYSSSLATRQLGDAVGGLLGVQDPELMRVKQRQSLLQGIDLNDPAALRERASVAMQQKDVAAALQLAQRAMAVEEGLAKLESEKALTAQRTAAANRETTQSVPADIQIAQRLSALNSAIPQYEAARDFVTAKQLKEERDQLTRITTKEGSKPSVVGVAEGTKQPVYSDGAQQFVYARGPDGTTIKQPYFGGVDRTTANISATANSVQKGRTAFSEELGKLDAKRVDAAQAARENAVTTLNSLNRLSSLDNQGLISGTFATGRVGVTNLLATLGLASDVDQRRLASSENYQKVAGDVILGTLGGKLGAGFSNEDRKFIQSLVPQLENSPAARRQLIDFMTRKNQDIVTEATRLETYARDNEGLKGFQPKIPFNTAPASSMSADDLAKAAGGKIVNGVFVKDK